MSNAFSLRCIYLSCKVLYFILSDDYFEIKSKVYSFNLRLVLKHILHSQDVFFRNLVFTLLFKLSAGHGFYISYMSKLRSGTCIVGNDNTRLIIQREE